MKQSSLYPSVETTSREGICYVCDKGKSLAPLTALACEHHVHYKCLNNREKKSILSGMRNKCFTCSPLTEAPTPDIITDFDVDKKKFMDSVHAFAIPEKKTETQVMETDKDGEETSAWRSFFTGISNKAKKLGKAMIVRRDPLPHEYKFSVTRRLPIQLLVKNGMTLTNMIQQGITMGLLLKNGYHMKDLRFVDGMEKKGPLALRLSADELRAYPVQLATKYLDQCGISFRDLHEHCGLKSVCQIPDEWQHKDYARLGMTFPKIKKNLTDMNFGQLKRLVRIDQNSWEKLGMTVEDIKRMGLTAGHLAHLGWDPSVIYVKENTKHIEHEFRPIPGQPGKYMHRGEVYERGL